MHLLSMTFSQRLKDYVTAREDHIVLGDICDLTSTAGYDNDGSTGPELIDNGARLAFAARDYDPQAIIFYAFGEEGSSTTAYYQFGKDENDMLRRLQAADPAVRGDGEP